MKLSSVFFRKMTIVYIIVIGLLSFELFVVGNYTVQIKSDLDDMVRISPFTLTYTSEQKSIKGATIRERIKTGTRLVKTDSSLKGNECIADASILRLHNIGDEIQIYYERPETCVIKEFKGKDISPYQLLISEEKYNSIPDDKYTYLVNIDGLDTLNNFEQDEDVVVGEYASSFFPSYYGEVILYQQNILILAISIIALAAIILILFVNTSSYIKANTKKTKKKNQKDNRVLLNIESSTLTITIAITIVYIFFVITKAF
jgi:hypothetical protein